MNDRERFLEVMNFNTSIRTLDWEFGYWYKTVQKWYDQGLEKKYGISGDLGDADPIVGPGIAYPLEGMPTRDRDIEEQLDLDKGFERVDIYQGIYPPFEPRVLEDEGATQIVIGSFGEEIHQKKEKNTIGKIIRGAIKDDKDWENFKEERLQIRYKDRKPANWEEIKKRYKNRDFPLSICGPPVGFFGFLRFLFGEPQIYYIFYDNPKLIHKINSYLCDFWINLFSEVLLEIDVDCAHFWEDMSGKQGSIISPAFFKEFMSPYYKRLTDFFRSKGIKYSFVDTDGNPDELIPLFTECGVGGMYPFEVQAGSDVVRVRKKYPKFLILGGLDKRILSQSKNEIDIELKSKLPFMLKEGGYVPYADHVIAPDATWENFKYFRNEIKKYLGK